jgi:cystine transport system substrate-binding protein
MNSIRTPWRRAGGALIALCFLSAGMAAAQPADLLAKARAAGVLRVANTQTSPPWSLVDASNQPAGYDVEVAREIARRIGVAKVVFIADSYKNFVEGLKAGKYDAVMNDLTPTAERARQVDFAAAYGVEDFRIFVRSGRNDIKGVADLRARRVGVTTGTSNETWARENLKGSDIHAYDNGGFAYSDLNSGRIDAAIASHFSGQMYLRALKVPIKEVGEPLVYQLSAPAVAQGQPALRNAMSAAVAAMLKDGTIDRLARKWVGADYDMPAMIAKAQKQ